MSPRSKLRELRATLDDDIGPAVAVLAAGLADDPDDTWRAAARGERRAAQRAAGSAPVRGRGWGGDGGH